MRWLVQSRLAIGYTLAIAVLLLNAVVTYSNLRTLLGNWHALAHTHDVLVGLDAVLSDLRDAETGQRGFLLTGSESYLQPYRRVVAVVDEDIDRLESLTADDPTQGPRVSVIRRKVAEKLSGLQESIHTRREGGLEAALPGVMTGRGKAVMDELRAIIRQAVDEQNWARGRLKAESLSAFRRTIATFSVASTLALALLGVMHHLNQRGQEALRKSEQWLATTLGSIGDAVIATDGQGHVTFLNAVARALTGWGQDEAVGRPLRAIFPILDERTRRPAENPVGRVLREGTVVGLVNHTALVARDGREIPIEDSAAPIRDGTGNILGVVLVFRDVSQQRRAEHEQRVALAREMAAQAETEAARLAEAEVAAFAARLERSNRDLQEFASVASHDLQEPLRKIQAFGDRLQTKYAEALGEQGRDYLERMQAAAARMRSLINDLLNFSRVASMRKPFVSVDLARVAQEVLSDLEGRIQKTGARVEVGDLPTLEADPTQMRQLLQNLIGNAMKFHRAGELPVVRLHGEGLPAPTDVPNGQAAGPHRCQITVQDDGIGFDEKYLDRIFNVFQRLHGRGEYDGTGMGLAISRRIVERHGGTITARSTPGRGATFLVTLPTAHDHGEEDR